MCRRASRAPPHLRIACFRTGRLISGGDALVAVAIPAGASGLRDGVGRKARLTGCLCVARRRTLSRRIEGLALGANVVTAQLPMAAARASPLPIIPGRAGPQRAAGSAWSCIPGASDALCRGREYQYFYVPAALTRRRRRRSSDGPGTSMRTFCYDPANPRPLRDRADDDRSGTQGSVIVGRKPGRSTRAVIRSRSCMTSRPWTSAI